MNGKWIRLVGCATATLVALTFARPGQADLSDPAVTSQLTPLEQIAADPEMVEAIHSGKVVRIGRSDAPTTAESGRGIQLMRALVDRVAFESRPEAGMIVHLEKRLEFTPDSPMRPLLAGVEMPTA